MIKQVIIGLATEGSTDIRFLESVVRRTFEDVALECSESIEIFDLVPLEKSASSSRRIEEKALDYAEKANLSGVMILCFHVDADNKTDDKAFNERVNPAFKAVIQSDKELCKNLIAIVPIQMTEAWMLVDKDLLKSELGTSKNDEELGINKKPETFADPKRIIEESIQIVRQEFGKRRRYQLKIDDLYQPIGQKINLQKLDTLSSYSKFKEAVREIFRKLNYLR